MRGVPGRHRRWRKGEAVAAPLTLATVAGAIDAVLLLAAIDAARRVSGAPSFWTHEFGEDPPWSRRETAVMVAVTAATIACDVLADGRTLGRAAAGIRLERDSGRPLDLPTAVTRELAQYGTGLVMKLPMRLLLRGNTAVMWAGALAIWAARLTARVADPQKRSLEDRIVGTRLVRSRPRRRG